MATGQQKGASIVGEANEQRKWEREEVVILVTEYFRTKNLTQDEIIDSQNQISIFLKKRERILTGVEPPDVFRNYAGIHISREESDALIRIRNILECKVQNCRRKLFGSI